jgi:hypothetical protein
MEQQKWCQEGRFSQGVESHQWESDSDRISLMVYSRICF